MGGRRQQGLSLVELVVSIVIISVAVAGVLSVFAYNVRNSADPQRTQQAVEVARAYLEEILARPVYNPAPGGSSTCGSPGVPRSNYDYVLEYDGLTNSPPQDQTGATLPLPGYTVHVSVTCPGSTKPTLGPAGLTVPASKAFRVDVTVSYGNGHSITLSGYKVSS
ncbi:MAG TPA: type II secretion system protein [Gammaproteobacteria bacterium]|nr:type II secretion system protein [Gammaproteobacteria bacterium]